MHTIIFPGASVHHGRCCSLEESAISVQSIISVDPLVCTLCQVFQQAELAGWVSFKDFVMQPKVEIIQKINLAKFGYNQIGMQKTNRILLYSDNSEFFFAAQSYQPQTWHSKHSGCICFEGLAIPKSYNFLPRHSKS